jgi:AcrR family transcriptional regulator
MPTGAAEATTPTRERILYAAAELFRRQGYAGTGVKQILAEARAPYGSLYHFFPGGKEELADAVLTTGGAFFLALYELIAADAPDLETAVGDFFAGAAETLAATGYLDACPIATVAGEIASSHEHLRVVCDRVFESWLTALQADAEAAGAAPGRARELAVSVLASLEGAFLLSRTARSTEPMYAARASALALVRTTIGGSP